MASISGKEEIYGNHSVFYPNWHCINVTVKFIRGSDAEL